MGENSTDRSLQELCDALACRIKVSLKRRQVALGRDKLFSLAKRKSVALIWASADLSRNATGKLKLECQRFGIPLLLVGESEDIGLLTGERSVKVYIIKKSFSGVNQFLRELNEFEECLF